jgi:hypothetical protein
MLLDKTLVDEMKELKKEKEERNERKSVKRWNC